MKNWVIKKKAHSPCAVAGTKVFSCLCGGCYGSSTTTVAAPAVCVAVREVVLGTFPDAALLALLPRCMGTTFVTLPHFREATSAFAEVHPTLRFRLPPFSHCMFACDHLLTFAETILLPLLADAHPHYVTLRLWFYGLGSSDALGV